MSGLLWLDDHSRIPDGWVSCLVFVRGSDVDEVFRGFGAGPSRPVTSPRLSGAPFPRMDAPEQILGRRCDDWTLVIDGTLPPQGLQLEVLQRISEGTDAVVIYNDVAKLNHELVHAHDGEIITAVTTSVPPHWDGTQPDRLRELAGEIGLGRGADTDFTDLQVLLVLAESVFGISLDEAGLEGSWYAAQVPTTRTSSWCAGRKQALPVSVPPPAVPKTRQITRLLLTRPDHLRRDEQAQLADTRAQSPTSIR